MKKQSPLMRIWELGEKEHARLIRSIVSAIIGVLGGMIPYYAAAQIIIALVNGERELSLYLTWCGIGLAGYIARTCLYTLALSMSHKAAFAVLKDIRRRVLEKLPKMPLGTIIDTSSGKMKQIIVDQVDSMETTLAHILPEMTSNILGAVCVILYLFILDLSLIHI